MQPYGRGKMLGSGINPESFKQDYSGFTRAAEIQAQGMSNLGANIGGAIEEVGDYFKKQKEDEKKVQKSLSVAKAIGDLIPGLQPTIQGSLDILNNKEIPLSQRTAEADAIADILNLGINEVRNRQDSGFKERELNIREAEALARNAPPMPEPFKFTGTELKKTDKGGIYVLQGNDGLDYDPITKLPIFDLDAFGKGRPPEVWSRGSTFSDDLGSMTTPSAFLPGENPSDVIDYANSLTENVQGGGFPTNLNIARPSPLLSPSQIESAANLSSNPLLGTRSGDNSDLLTIGAADQAALKPRYITDERKAEEGKIMSQEEIIKLIQQGFKVSGKPAENGGVFVTSIQSLAPQIGKEVVFNPDGTLTTRDIPLGGESQKLPSIKLGEGEQLVADPNSPTGTKVVKIPSELVEKNKKDFSGYIEQMSDSYARLYEMGKAVTGGNTNPLNFIESTGVGQNFSRMFGSEPQVLRDQINTMRPSIINVIRQASEMGAKGLDSEKELAFYLSALGDPTLPVEANIKALDVLDEVYGTGKAVSVMLKEYPELGKKVQKYNLKAPTEKAPTSSPFTLSPEAEDVSRRHSTGK